MKSIITQIVCLLAQSAKGMKAVEISNRLGASIRTVYTALARLECKNPPIVTHNDNAIWTWAGINYEGRKSQTFISDLMVDEVYSAISKHHGISAAKINEITEIPRDSIEVITRRLRLNGKIYFSRESGWVLSEAGGSAQTNVRTDVEVKNKTKQEEKMGPIGITDEDLAWMEWYHPDNRANRFAARIRGD